MKKLFEHFMNSIQGKERKKIIENAVIVIIIGIIIIIAGGSIFGGDKKEEGKNGADKIEPGSVETAAKVNSTKETGDLEKNVESILEQIGGAGKVSVMITYVSGSELVPAYDTKRNQNDTLERDNGGGTRDVKQSDTESRVVYSEDQGGQKKPVIVKEILPPVKGVVVVAEGAHDPVVKENLCKAVQVLLEVPIHKIQVFERTE
ncbi:MAG: stage III sporulation protein AG [Clostridia bacterium]|nr:stage III sporulation protein AG [Clostridia bacterium]